MVQDLWPPLHYQDWILTRSPIRYPVVSLGHGDPVALALQDWPHHELQQFTDGVNAGVGQFNTLDLGLGSS